jgi:hypothetical protein
MKLRIFEVQKEPGFRLSVADLGFVVLLAVVSLLLRWLFPGTSHWGLPLYLGGSFFLFCNVFRIGNRLEICWYVPFTVLAAYGVGTDGMDRFWWQVLFVLEPIKWALVGYRVMRGPYWGAGHRLFWSGRRSAPEAVD